MENGTLLQHIQANPTEDRRKLCADISAGVVYLHQNEIIHGDIKSANVLVSGRGVAKLADFGCTELKTSTLLFTATASSPGISIRWAAPEILNGHTARSKEADVYALGMTFLEVVTGMVPFSDIKTDVAVCTAVVTKRKIPERPEQMHSFEGKGADRLWELMVCLWDRNPAYRPDSTAVQNLVSYRM
ncbi:hypothetical protein FRC09_001255 [Ceratobasidium sp. 395]|nr:hypothetical protein FRC09_001255 [Ceratobasidium sp. 395]